MAFSIFLLLSRNSSSACFTDPYANSSFTQQDIDMIFSPEFQGLAPKKPKGKEAQNASFDIEDFKRLKNKFPDDDA